MNSLTFDTRELLLKKRTKSIVKRVSNLNLLDIVGIFFELLLIIYLFVEIL